MAGFKGEGRTINPDTEPSTVNSGASFDFCRHLVGKTLRNVCHRDNA